jgi:hypothetical protein
MDDRSYIELECEQLHQMPHDGEPQAIAIARAVGGNAKLIELIVNKWQQIR